MVSLWNGNGEDLVIKLRIVGYNVRCLDTIGYIVEYPVPEPSAAASIGVMLLSSITLCRRRKLG